MKLNLTSNVDRQSKPMGMPGGRTAAARYNQLAANRDSYLQRARDCSKVTIPGLIPEAHGGEAGDLKTPYQLWRTRHKLFRTNCSSLFPPNAPFFKLEIDDLALRVAEAGLSRLNSMQRW